MFTVHSALRNVSEWQVEHTIEKPMQVLGSPNFSANAIEKICVLDFKQPGTKASHSHVIVSNFLVTAICLISFLVCGMMLRAFFLFSKTVA